MHALMNYHTATRHGLIGVEVMAMNSDDPDSTCDACGRSRRVSDPTRGGGYLERHVSFDPGGL
jgi:hypothetical protein